MALYLITYDLRKQGRNYQGLYNVFTQWNAVSLLQSVWLAQLRGPATEVRNILKAHLDANDGIAVLNTQNPPDWATFGVPAAADAVLIQNLGLLNR